MIQKGSFFLTTANKVVCNRIIRVISQKLAFDAMGIPEVGKYFTLITNVSLLLFLLVSRKLQTFEISLSLLLKFTSRIKTAL